MERNTRSGRLRAADSNTNKFLRDFDPQRSEREKRKLHRRLYPGSKKHVLYDETGILIKTGSNLCDCLHNDCPGCHFPCSKCGSTKCGHECSQLTSMKLMDWLKTFPAKLNMRAKGIKWDIIIDEMCIFCFRANRKWIYDSIENEGSDIVMKNPSIKES